MNKMVVSFLYSIMLLLLIFSTTTSTSASTIVSHNTIHEKVSIERRFVVYNSRRLTGECLPICQMENNKAPSESPAIITQDPTTLFPTLEENAIQAPTGTPTLTVSSIMNVVGYNSDGGGGGGGQAMEACLCGVNDYEWDQSWKCGNDNIYVCPSIDTICSTQGSTTSNYYLLSEEQCTTMRSIDIGQQCITLLEYGIVKPDTLSSRVCYKNEGSLGFNGMKQDDNSCDTCSSRIKITFETTVVP